MLDDWTAALCSELDVDPAQVDIDLVLDLARDAAHGVARPAAPLTTFLVGWAAARAGGTEDDVRAAAVKAARLASDWPRTHPESAAADDSDKDSDTDTDSGT